MDCRGFVLCTNVFWHCEHPLSHPFYKSVERMGHPESYGNLGRRMGKGGPPANYPDYKGVFCVGEASKNNAVSFGADALGVIPGEGRILVGVQLAAADLGFVNGLITEDAKGLAEV